ncbi:MAG: methionyl aminopeptidase [Chlamydiales bacterium]
MSRNSPCWCGSKKKWKHCHYPLESMPNFATMASRYLKQYQIRLKTEKEILCIRKACKTASSILHKLCAMATIGTTTKALDIYARKLHKEAGAVPAPLGYGSPPFPCSICTSLNSVICHGIPNDLPLQDGDILNIDVTAIVDGFYGDCSAMVCIGSVSKEKQLVVNTSYEALMQSISLLKPGVLLCEIGNSIEAIAKRKHCSVVYQFVGHGIGIQFHEPPQIPHYANDIKIPLAPGMVFTIEPMINAGVPEAVIDRIDHWTARTADGSPSAQWEHTILITEFGHEVLTKIK